MCYLHSHHTSLIRVVLIRVTDKLLFEVFTQFFFLEYPIVFKQNVSMSKGIIEYPIKMVDVT